MTDRQIILATRNPGKLREIRQVLASIPVKVVGLDEVSDVPEPEENGATFAENSRDKALYYARATGQWCLADDSGLEVDALDGAPGVRSARYAEDLVPADASRDEIDSANNRKLLQELQNVPEENRTARFVCHLTLASPQQVLLETFDTIEGRIGYDYAGENGFGYDPLFFVPQLGCTTAQLDSQQKNSISHRGKAVRHFGHLLERYLASDNSEQ